MGNTASWGIINYIKMYPFGTNNEMRDDMSIHIEH